MSNIVIIEKDEKDEKEEDLQTWLEKRGLTILVRKNNYGWRADFQQPYTVRDTPAGPVSGSDAAQAVTHFVNWLFGATIATGDAREVVPRFTGVEKAIAAARRSSKEPT